MDRVGSTTKRIVYLDYLRILSGVLVVMVHVSARRIEEMPVDGFDYAITNAFNCLAFSGVALFVMISGALALQPERETGIKKLLLRKTVRFFALYYIWKAIYQAAAMLESGTAFTFTNIKNEIVLALIQQRGYYHLWFLPMIAIVYMSVPVIRKGVADKNVCRYFLCVFFFVEILFPTLFHYEFKFKYLFVDFFASNDFYLFGGYLGYFILGHYLHHWSDDLSRRTRRLLYLAGGCGWILAGALGTLASRGAGEPSYIMNTPFAAPVFFTITAIFIAGQSLCAKAGHAPRTRDEDTCDGCARDGRASDGYARDGRASNGYARDGHAGDERAGGVSISDERLCDKPAGGMLRFCADRVLGIYLLHPLVINLFGTIGFDASICSPVLSIPLVTLCVFIVSGLISAILSFLPVIRKLIC